MPQTFTLTVEQYEALISLARQGTGTADKARELEAFLRQIETASGVTRSCLWIQWQEQDQPLPPAVRFPATWPPSQRFYLELLSRPIARVDVESVLVAHARRPVNVLVTSDVGATLGWCKVEDYFLQ